MLRRIVLLGVLVFVVTPVAWVGVEHLRGRAQLAAAVARIEARGETLDLKRMLQPSVQSSSSNGLPSQINASQRLADLREMLPPAFEMLGPGRAIPGTRLDGWPGPNGTNSWEDLAQALSGHATDLADLREAMTRPMRRSDLDVSQGFARMKIPHLLPIKNSVTALAASASEAAHRGDMDAAVADLLAMRVVEADLADEPILISQLVRIACASIANSRVWSVSYARDWDEKQLARLQEALPGWNFVPALARSMQGERAGSYYEIMHAPTKELADIMTGDAIMAAMGNGPAPLQMPTSMDDAAEFADSLMKHFGRGVLASVVLPVWRFGWGDQAAAFSLECMDVLIETLRKAGAANSFAVAKALDLEDLTQARSTYMRLRTVYARYLMSSLGRSVEQAFRVENERSLHEAGLAIRRFELRHHRLPENLADLVPDFLTRIPVDYMDGKPLRYRRDGEKGFILWSVGMDLKDDGGDGSWPQDRVTPARAQWWAANDVVWPQSASAAEIEAWQVGESAKLAAKKAQGTVAAGVMTMSAELMKRYGLVPRVPQGGGGAATNQGVKAGAGGK